MVTIAEAALCFGVSQDTIRRWMVDLELKESENGTQATTELHTREGAGAGTGGEQGWEALVAILQSQVAGQQEQLSAKDQQLETKDQQIRELHILLQQAQSALPAPIENHHSTWWRFWGK